MQECNSVFYGYRRLEDVTCGAYLGQKCLLWGILGHGWDVITRMNFTEFHIMLIFNVLNILKKTHALGRSLVIFKISASHS